MIVGGDSSIQSEDMENSGYRSVGGGCINLTSAERIDSFTISATNYSTEDRDAFRRQLKYYFMNPIDKWRSKKKFPWKIVFQMLKLFIVSMQVYFIGKEMSRFITHQSNMKITFRELFLEDWDPVREVMTYPPAAGPFAVYTKSKFYENIDFAIKALSNITENGLGSFAYDSNAMDEVSIITLNIKKFSVGQACPFNYSYSYNKATETKIVPIIPPYPASDPRWHNFSIEKYLADANSSLNFDNLIKLKLIMGLRTIYLDELDQENRPKCYRVTVSINFDNYLHDGQITISLEAHSERQPCNGNLDNSYGSWWASRRLITFLVIILCFSSAILCLRSLVKSILLRQKTINFFHQCYNIDLSFPDRCEFIDTWIILILVNDILLIFGSVIKLTKTVDYSSTATNDYSVLFGIGILMTWLGLLRYFSFFDKFNIVILTVKKAFPDIMKFAICAVLLYM